MPSAGRSGAIPASDGSAPNHEVSKLPIPPITEPHQGAGAFSQPVRLTQYAHGGGCACKIPPGELEAAVAGLIGGDVTGSSAQLLVGLDDGDDAAVVRLAVGIALI